MYNGTPLGDAINAMRPAFHRSGAAVLFLAGACGAQCFLATTFGGANTQKGNMFDVVAINGVQVVGFDQNLMPGVHGLQLYTKTGSWNGFQGTPAAWTLVGTASGLSSSGYGVPTALPIPVSISIPAGATQAFYITSTGPLNLAYSTGTQVGATAAQDLNVRILEGAGIMYPFGTSFQPRIWNGLLRYTSGFPEYQVNQPGASLSLDNLQGTPCDKAVTNRTVCSTVGATTTVNVNMSATAAGAPFDLVYTVTPAIPASGGSFVTVHGQVVNLNLGDPTLTALFGLSGSVPFVDASIPVTIGLAVDATVQMVVVDAMSPDGISISQANELHVTNIPAPPPLPGPSDDDGYVTYSFERISCGPASFPFYGTSYTSFSVVSNGRVMFGTPNTGYTPAPPLAMAQSPSIDAWVDLNPDPNDGCAGHIMISLAALGVVRVQWTNIPYYGSSGTSNTFAIVMDSNTGAITIDGLPTFQPIPGPNNGMFLGLSPGGPLAADPGPVTFSFGGPHPGPAGSGMLYQFGPTGTLATGAAGLTFVPNGSNNYAWSGY